MEYLTNNVSAIHKFNFGSSVQKKNESSAVQASHKSNPKKGYIISVAILFLLQRSCGNIRTQSSQSPHYRIRMVYQGS